MEEALSVTEAERPSKRWLVGLATVVLLAAVGIVAHFVVLGRVLRLEQEQAAWQAAMDERLEEDKRLDEKLRVERADLLQIEANIQTTRKQTEDAGKALAGIEANVASARKQFADIQNHAATAKAAYEVAAAETLRLLDVQKSTRRNIDRLSGEQRALLGETRKATQKLAEKQLLLDQIKLDREEAASLRERVAQHKKLLAELIQKAQDAEARIGPFEDLDTELRAKVAKLNGHVGRAEAELAKAGAALEKTRSDETKLQVSVAQLEERGAILADAVKILQGKYDALKEKEGELQTSLTRLTTADERAKARSDKYAALVEQDRGELDDLLKRKATLRKDEPMLEASIGQLRERETNLSNVVKTLRGEYDALKEKEGEIQVSLAKLIVTAEQAKVRSGRYTALVGQDRGELDDLLKRKANLRNDLTNLRDDITKLKEEKQALEDEVVQLLQQQETLRGLPKDTDVKTRLDDNPGSTKEEGNE